MWTAAVFVLLLLAPSPVASQNGIWGFIEDVFQFLCGRCKDVVGAIDNFIDNQPFRKELDGFCRTFIPEPTLQAICVNVVDTILGGIYDQLQRIEPRPEVCTNLRLCLECGVPAPDIWNGGKGGPQPRPTLPSDLFGPDDLFKESPFARRARGVGGGVVEFKNKNDSRPFDPVEFYSKVAELATTVARLKRMAAPVPFS